MKNKLGALGLVMAVGISAALVDLPAVHAAGSHALALRPLASKCSATGYTHGKCQVVPRHGRFTIHAPGSNNVVLQGIGTASTAGTKIIIAAASAPHPPAGARVFKIVADGPFPPLTPANKKDQLYKYNPSTGKWNAVSAVTGSGIYALVPAKK